MMKTNNLTKILTDVNKSLDVVVSINGKVVGGQQNAQFSQQRSSINITNKIDPQWQENLAGTRSWNVRCTGLYVMNSEALADIQDAFMTDKTVTVSLTIDGKQYSGETIITDFPLNAIFDSGLKYSLTLLGTGPLTQVGKP